MVVVAALLLVVYTATFFVASGLRFEPVKDEVHFAETAHSFSESFPPSLGQLRNYPEVITPLAFVLWGQLDRWFGDALYAGRWLNLLLSIAIVSAIVFRRWGADGRSLRAGVGLLVFPYFLPLSVHLYTDILAAALAIGGLILHQRGRMGPSFLLLALSIATRQYAVAIPAALAAWEGLRFLRGERDRWLPGLSASLAAATLLGWFAFFGGVAPRAGMDFWLPMYPAPMLSMGEFIVPYAVYFVTCLGAYFVVPEWLLFHRRIRWDVLIDRRSALLLAALAVIFLAFPPLFESRAQGALDRVVRALLPSGDVGHLIRVAFFFLLAACAVLRFGRRVDLATCLVLANALLMTKTQLAWEKYLTPVLMALWYFQSRGVLDRSIFWPADSDEQEPPQREPETSQGPVLAGGRGSGA